MSALPDLVQRAQDFGQYHVPDFAITVGKENLRRDWKLDVTSVSVDRSLGAAGRFTFSVGNLFDLKERAFGAQLAQLALGTAIEIRIGYANQNGSAQPVEFSGLVTEVSVGFQAGGVPQVTVSGYDRLILLTKQKRTRVWNESSDSDVISALARRHGLEPDVQATSERHATVEQREEPDFDLLKKLAEHNDLEFYVEKNKLVCRTDQRTDRRSPSLKWGAGLISFTPETNLSQQVSEVEVIGWDVRQKKEIVGTAKRGEEQGRQSGETSGGDVIAKLTADTKLTVRRAVRTQQEARDIASQLLQRRAREFLKGSGECSGMPELVIDSKLGIDGIGAPYSREYYVEQVVHTLSTAGYRTTFKVRDPAL